MSDRAVSLVVPVRDGAPTIGACLDAVVPLLEADGSTLREIIVVDDGSCDDTARIARGYPVTCLDGPSLGPGGARNRGWRAATSPLIWFVDADCVAEPDALELLLPLLDDPDVGGAGGSYHNLETGSLLACLVHQEIMVRHDAMPARVDFLGGFNTLYRREVLERLGGFDEQLFNGPGSPGAEDAELAYRVRAADLALGFEPRSRVGHVHPTRLGRYLRSQRRHGCWRVALHLRHPGKTLGDDYGGVIDAVQPSLALLAMVTAPLLAAPLLTGWAPLAWIPIGVVAALLLTTVPMTLRIVRRSRRARLIAHSPMSAVRAIWRGVGMVHGAFTVVARRAH